MSTMEANERKFPFLRTLLKKIVYLIVAVVVAGTAGFLYSTYMVKPTYKATSAVILRMSSDVTTSGKTTTEITLAKYYLPTIADIIVSPAVIKTANSKYEGEGKISAGSIEILYGEESLIFSIAYNDKNKEVASKKLDAFIASAKEYLSSNTVNLVKAEDVTLIQTQNKNTISVDTGVVKNTLLGAVIGGAIVVLVLYVIYRSDNTVTNKSDFEEMTGVDVLTTISKI